MDGAGAFAMFLAAGGTMVALLLGPVGQALARRIGKKPSERSDSGLTTGEMAAQRLAAMEARLAELEGVAAHVDEIEERLDFAERMLTQQDPKSMLPGDRV